MNRDIGRIIDANINRTTEGLRVVEDIVRYLHDDAPMQQRLKTLRHRIASEFDSCALIISRDAGGDVGLDSKGLLEDKRTSFKDLVKSNMKRVQEGLRVLEEVMKLDFPDKSRIMKAARYESYQVERDIELMDRKSIARGLYLILTEPASGYERMTEMAVSAGLPAVQLRYKKGDSREFLRLARALRKITLGTETLFIVNDRLDIALLAEADGVHLGQNDLPPKEARSLAGDRLLIGLSTHTLAQLEQAQKEPVDYVGFGPVFSPFSKNDHESVTGVGMLKEAVDKSGLPVVAIGGINHERLEHLAGIAYNNVACIGAVAFAEDPEEEMRALHAMIGEKP